VLLLKTGLLFIITALAEIVGCYLPYLWLKKGYSAWLLVPAAFSLVLFVWLLSLHPTASGRLRRCLCRHCISLALRRRQTNADVL